MSRPPLRRGSPSCPDLLRDGGGPCSPLSPFFRSFFEEECRRIAARLRTAAAATPRPSPGPEGDSALWPPPGAGPVTSTPVSPSPPPLAGGSPGGAARPRGEPRRLPLPRAAPGPRSRPQPRGIAQGPAGRSPGRGGGRPSPPPPRVPMGPEPPRAVPGALPARLPVPPGTKAVPAARSRLQPPSRAPRPSALPRAAPRDSATHTAAKAGACRQPSQRLPTAIPSLASRSRLQLPGKVVVPKLVGLELTPQEPVCNRTRELMENGESKELAARAAMGADKADQTWVCVESPYLSELLPGPSPGCGGAAPAVQSAGCHLCQELKHVKAELERVKGELADKTAQCEAYCQAVSSLQAQLRAAGICPEDAAVGEIGVLGRDFQLARGTDSQQRFVQAPVLPEQ